MISVIVPVYNVRQYIDEFMNSLLNQTFQDLEIILVDDGSTDGTGEKCDRYQTQNKKVLTIHKPNGGVTSAWKMGFEYSKGEYVNFVDPDDYLEINMYEKMFQAMMENKADLVVSGIYYVRDGKRYPTLATTCSAGLYEGKNLEFVKKNLFGSKEQPEHVFKFFKVNKLFQRQMIQNNYQYNDERISFGDDVCICASAIFDSKRLFVLDEYLYNYRIREGSITTKPFHSKEADNALLLCNTVMQLLKDKGYYTDYAFFNDFSYHITYLIKKISQLQCGFFQKKKYFSILKNHTLVREFDLAEAKPYLSSRRVHAIQMLKSPLYSLMCLKKLS